jgi:23S rRNA pseudouridine2605 synthase
VSDERGERLQKVLAAAGLGSRRACEELIEAGRVTVDGEVAQLGDRVDPMRAEIRVDGERVNVNPTLTYLMLNKPRGVVTTADDPEGRPTIYDLVNVRERVFPVGRLDMDTEGLLLLTNDGTLAHALMHPSSRVPRTYVAQVRGKPGRRHVRGLRSGVELDDGPASAEDVRVLGDAKGSALVEIVLTEGRKREVRRMLAAVGLPVERLARVAFDGVEIGDLRQGKWRPLTQREISRLYAAVGSVHQPAPGERLFGRPGPDEDG